MKKIAVALLMMTLIGCQSVIDHDNDVVKDNNISSLNQTEPKKVNNEEPDVEYLSSILDNNLQDSIKGFSYSGGGRGGASLELSNYEHFRIAFLKLLFDPTDPNYGIAKFEVREETDYDKKIIQPQYQHSWYKNDNSPVPSDYIFLETFYVLELNKKISLDVDNTHINEPFDSLAIYVYNDELYVSFYDDGEFLKGLLLNPNKQYDKMFEKVNVLIEDLEKIYCNGSCI